METRYFYRYFIRNFISMKPPEYGFLAYNLKILFFRLFAVTAYADVSVRYLRSRKCSKISEPRTYTHPLVDLTAH